MTQLFILQNQHKNFLNKQNEWVDGRDANSLFKTLFKDEALNQMIETGSKDYTLRIHILECGSNDKGRPVIAEEDLPPLMLKMEPTAEESPDTDSSAIESSDVKSTESESPEAESSEIDSPETQSTETEAAPLGEFDEEQPLAAQG